MSCFVVTVLLPGSEIPEFCFNCERGGCFGRFCQVIVLLPKEVAESGWGGGGDLEQVNE